MLELPCRLCDQTIEADNEDELVERMQTHARDAHDKTGLSRQHILRHVRAGEVGPSPE